MGGFCRQLVEARIVHCCSKMTSEEGDIDDLLDSALEDFDNLPKPKTKKTLQNKPNIQPDIRSSSTEPTEEDFMKIFESAGLEGGAAGLKKELDKLAELAEGGQGQDIAASLVDTLADMRKQSAGLSSQPTDEELQGMFSGLGLGGSSGMQDGLNNLLPMMEGMMQSLLSKDLLYPAIKELADKYPDYLADNRSNLSDEQFQNYNKQCDLTRNICFKFEEESPTDTEAEKKARFQEVMALMQEMQSLGNPPKELTGETPGAFQLDPHGNPILPDLRQECVIS